MTLLLKDSAALIDYAVDWGAGYLVDDTIVTSAWSVDPDEPGGLSVTGDTAAATMTGAKVAGGIAGRVYRLVNHVVLGSGCEDERSVVIRVEAR